MREQASETENERSESQRRSRPDQLGEFQHECNGVAGAKAEAGDAFQRCDLGRRERRSTGSFYTTGPRRPSSVAKAAYARFTAAGPRRESDRATTIR